MPSSGRKVSRASVTKGARGTEKQQKAAVFRCFQVNPSPASRQPPLPQGNGKLGRFSALCRREKQTQNLSFQHRKRRKTASRAFSLRHSVPAPSRREPVFVRVFSLYQRANSAKIRCLPNNPSVAPRQLPLHKGAMSRCDFSLCAAQKTETKIKPSKPKICTFFFSGRAVGQQ